MLGGQVRLMLAYADGVFPRSFLATMMPWTAPDWPATPMYQTASRVVLHIALPLSLRLPSLRSRYPSASFWVSPALCSRSFACFWSNVDHFCRHSGPGLYLFDSAGAPEPGVPTPRKKVSLICSRSMPSESARRKSRLLN